MKLKKKKERELAMDITTAIYEGEIYEGDAKIAPPWIQYVNELNAMFRKDPEIKIVYDNDTTTVKLLVDNVVKADALSQILPMTKEYGNRTLKIEIVPSNEIQTPKQIFEAAFSGNPAFDSAVTVTGVFTNPLTYVVFAKEVVQFFNDNLGDLHGNMSTLYQDIAKHIFDNVDGVTYCTTTGDEEVGKPLGEWP